MPAAGAACLELPGSSSLSSSDCQQWPPIITPPGAHDCLHPCAFLYSAGLSCSHGSLCRHTHSIARRASQLHHALPSTSEAATNSTEAWPQQWTRQVAGWLVAAGLAIALMFSPTAYAAVFPFTGPPPAAPAAMEMKV